MKRESNIPYRVVPGSPPELVVYDEPQACPYLPERVARLPLRIPSRPLTRVELETRLASGDRRQGIFLYHTSCPSCAACEPIRIRVRDFLPGRTQRRTLARGDARLSVELGPPLADELRVALYNRHKELRGLGVGRAPIDIDGYREFLVLSSCESFELRYLLGSELVGVAIVDRAEDALSAVYCYYDPSYESLSLGTYSILKQIELCRHWGLEYLYLGLYIGESAHMRYKAGFVPHERLLDGRWTRFDRP
jgi:arginine-tRNA-protein transferase